MRTPVKINQHILPVWLRKLLPCKDDPRNICWPDLNIFSFEDSISAIKIDTTWKTIRKKRHLLTDQLISEEASCIQKPSILEVGASSGSTSLDLLDRLSGSYKQYFVTDLFFTIPYKIKDNVTYFYHPLTKHCIMRASDWYIVYEDVQAAFFPLGLIARKLLACAPQYDPNDSLCASMLHPELKSIIDSDSRIVVKEYDIFDAWPDEMIDIIKVANVLNRTYFSDEKIRLVIVNLKNALKIGGKLIITDNRDVEKVSIFSKTIAERLILERELNGGSDISFLVKEA